MFERRTKVAQYTREQTFEWLSWLAQSMARTNQSIFYIDWMQPDLLPLSLQQWLIKGLPFILFSLCGLFSRPLYSLLWLVAFGAAITVLYDSAWNVNIRPVVMVRWSWRELLSSESLLILLLVVAVQLSFISVSNLYYNGRLLPEGGLLGASMLSGGWMIWIIIGGIETRSSGLGSIDIPDEPMTLIRRSLRYAVTTFSVVGLLVVLFDAVRETLLDHPAWSDHFGHWRYWYARVFLPLGIGLINGGSAYIKHFGLRALLWQISYGPWKYVQFLDFATERIFMRKVGGGYIFTHRLLMEYFSKLSTYKPAKRTSSE
jgi:hypothetical protein